MPISETPAPTRRSVLAALAGLSFAGVVSDARRAAAAATYRLVPSPATARLLPAPYPETAVWAYDGSVPGPEIRVRQGDRVRVLVENGLAEDTTVHWHGIRLPNAMDGVPHLTQPPIPPGGSFLYEFDAVDAGTYWYHPHQRSAEQVDRGLAGALIVEEAEPPAVDRDVTWVIDDWRLLDDASVSADFDEPHDFMMAGRLGNIVTVNGAVRKSFNVRAGERIRLRLINVANARILALAFEGHAPVVIALDGQPVAPHSPDGGLVVLGPAMRADLILDMTGRPGERFRVVDRFNPGREFRLFDLAYTAEALRDRPPEGEVRLPANPLAEPDLAAAERHSVGFAGGGMAAMHGMMHGGSTGGIWTINGVGSSGHAMAPFLTIGHGRTCVLAMHNDTAFHHPIHLHGHSFRVLSRNGVATRLREWRDTVLMNPRERVEIAFVADNPGDWMFHCHILEHQAAGMMGVIRVAPAADRKPTTRT